MVGWSRDQKQGGIHSPEPNSIVTNIQEDPNKSRNNLTILKSVPVTGPIVAQRVDRGIALLFNDRDTRRR